MKAKDLARLEAKTTKPSTSTCWIYTGATSNGYGRFWLEGKLTLVHRESYKHHIGPIVPGLVIDHLCRTRACINPDHLEPVTAGENVLRGEGRSAVNALREDCLNGHPFDEANTYVRSNGARACKKCQTARHAAWLAKQEEAAA